jgi:hypothetical protein
MQRRRIAAAIMIVTLAVVCGVMLRVKVLAGPEDQHPAATIDLPAPGAARDLLSGCNTVTLTFPDGTPAETVLQAVAPANTIETVFRENPALDGFEGFSLADPGASDLMVVNRLDAVWLCTDGLAPAQPPTPPNRFFGDVTIDGLPAPAGNNITATISGNVCGQTTVAADSTYVLDVVSSGQTAGCGTEGATVQFIVAGLPAGTATWHSGYFTELDLAAPSSGEGTLVRIGSGSAPTCTVDTVPLEVITALVSPPLLVGAATVDIQYDPAVVEPTGWTAGPDWDTALCSLAYGPNTVRCTGIDAQGVTGEVLLADLTFHCIGETGQSSPLDVQVVTLADPNGNSLPQQDDDGAFLCGLCGDVDCGGDIDAVDALFILQYVVGLRGSTDQCPLPTPPPETLFLPGANVNGDTGVDAIDALFVLQCVVGLRSCDFQCSGSPIGPATPPNRFFGDVTMDGAPAPAGTNVTTRIGGHICGQTTVQADSRYLLDVASVGQTGGCGTEGTQVEFRVAGTPVGSWPWSSGRFSSLDLPIPPNATPTPIPTPVSTPGPTPTPVPGTEAVYLVEGCNPLAMTWPNGTPTQTVAAAVWPPSVLHAMWRYGPVPGVWAGYSPLYPEESDLAQVEMLDAVFICVDGSATLSRPVI